jgi:hypothetical protein
MMSFDGAAEGYSRCASLSSGADESNRKEYTSTLIETFQTIRIGRRSDLIGNKYFINNHTAKQISTAKTSRQRAGFGVNDTS